MPLLLRGAVLWSDSPNDKCCSAKFNCSAAILLVSCACTSAVFPIITIQQKNKIRIKSRLMAYITLQ